MSTIPCYQERVKAMVFKLHFIDKVEEIKPVGGHTHHTHHTHTHTHRATTHTHTHTHHPHTHTHRTWKPSASLQYNFSPANISRKYWRYNKIAFLPAFCHVYLTYGICVCYRSYLLWETT